MRRRLQTTSRAEGFTLIELLIVIVILGVLAGVVVLAVNGITDRGESSACKADKKTIEIAEEASYAKDSMYRSEADLVSAGLLKDESEKYDVAGLAPTPSPTTYTVVSAGTCP